jgi:hypothetical protein
MHFRPAPLQFVLAIKRRLEQTNPGARLDEKSVRLVGVPMTQFDATIFLFEQNGKTKLVAELARPDLPHIYVGKTLPPDASKRATAAALVWCITHIGYRILHDSRFSRGNIIRVNGFSPA